jgi:outer membrane protein insertion porin family
MTRLGGKLYYLGHAEIEIPLGAGAREMGCAPQFSWMLAR